MRRDSTAQEGYQKNYGGRGITETTHPSREEPNRGKSESVRFAEEGRERNLLGLLYMDDVVLCSDLKENMSNDNVLLSM